MPKTVMFEGEEYELPDDIGVDDVWVRKVRAGYDPRDRTWRDAKGNWLSLGMLLALLKGMAKLTPSVHDDKVVTLFQKVLGIAESGQKRKMQK